VPWRDTSSLKGVCWAPTKEGSLASQPQDIGQANTDKDRNFQEILNSDYALRASWRKRFVTYRRVTFYYAQVWSVHSSATPEADPQLPLGWSWGFTPGCERGYVGRRIQAAVHSFQELDQRVGLTACANRPPAYVSRASQ
jgi:hypothetical protein